MTAPDRVRTVTAGAAAPSPDLAVYEWGTAGPDRPTVVLMHGWPDSHEVWDLVAPLLARDHHVVAFDARGVGDSTLPDERRSFTLERMADDIGTVIGAFGDDGPVHLVGHDWGGVEGWEYVMRSDTATRVASFTSVSGPNLDFYGATIRGRRRDERSIRPLARQALSSGYTIVLSLPVVRTAIWRLGFARPFRVWLKVTEGIERSSGYPGDDLVADAVAAVGLYRSNIWRKLRRPDPRPVDVPVQVVVAARDHYVNPTLVADVGEWVGDLTVSRIDAGHWSPRTHPAEVADAIALHIASVESRTERTPS